MMKKAGNYKGGKKQGVNEVFVKSKQQERVSL